MLVLPLAAQSDAGSVVGTATDKTGALVANATVTLTNKDTGQTRTVQANAKGEFSFDVVQRGQYTAHIEANGFQSQDQAFELRVSQTQKLAFSLATGQVSQTVEVTDSAPIVDVSTSSTGLVVESEQMTNLPLNGRNFTQLALLTPGVTRGSYNSAASGSGGGAETFRYGETGGGALSTNGLRQQANNFELDGLDNNELLVGTIVFFPPVEATQEFRISTTLSSAAFGGAGGAVIQSSIKSGTNNIHGSAFFFDRDQIFDANPIYQFTTPTTLKNPTFHRTQFGGTLGGPIRFGSFLRDKLFLFGDYQGLRQEQPQGQFLTSVPSALERTGDFSELLSASNGLTTNGVNTFYVPACNGNPPSAPNGTIFNPVTCKPFAFGGKANVIDPSMISQAGLHYLQAFPLPNHITNGSILFNNYQSIPEQVQRYDDFDVRLDANITSKDTLFARYSYGQDILIIASALPNLPAGFGAGYNPTHPRGIATGYTHIFSPHVINEARYGFTRPFYGYTNPFNNIPLGTQLGIPDSNRSPLEGGLPQISGGFTSTGDSGLYQVPQQTQQIVDNLTWSKGAHTLQFGTNILFHQVKYFQIPCAKGCFDFENDFTGYAGADLLAGFAHTYNVGIGVPQGFINTRNMSLGFFAQDDWKATKRLTLNLGLRYEIFTYPHEANNNLSNFDLKTQTLLEAGKNGNSRTLVNNNYNNFGPRVGFAYDLRGNGSSSLRGGFGVYYFQERGGGGNSLFSNPDFNGTTTATDYNGARITLSGMTPICPPNTPSTPTCNTAPVPPYLYNNNAGVATGSLPVPAFGSVINPANPAGASVISQDPHSPTSIVQEYNLQFEQRLDRSTSFTVAYVGTNSDNLLTSFNLNTQQLNANYSPTGAYPNLNTINRLVNAGVGNDNALQVQLHRTLDRGVELTAAYTWAKALDDSNGAFFSGANSAGNRIEVTNGVPNLNGYLGNYGNSDQDIRHSFSFSALADIPYGHGRLYGRSISRTMNELLGGYQLNTIVTLESGSPFDVTSGEGTTPSGLTTYAVPNERADRVGTGSIRYPKKLTEWFDYTQFTPPPALYTPTSSTYPVFTRQGTLSRNAVFGPSYRTMDLALFKYVDFPEKITGQFRVQVYNLTNTPQFQNPNGEVDPDHNLPQAGIDNGVASQINGTRLHSERQIELAFRLFF